MLSRIRVITNLAAVLVGGVNFNRSRKIDFPMTARFAVVALAAISMLAGTTPASAGGKHRAKLLDISGLIWIRGDVFLAVSDAKTPEEKNLTRVSLLSLATSLDGIGFRKLSPRFPGGLSSDFESAAGIPGSRKFLMAESGDDGMGKPQRIFLAKLVGKRSKRERIRILDFVEWDSFTPVKNVESTAVAATDTGSKFTFIWAERNTGETFTYINWADMWLDPFQIAWNDAQKVKFTLPDYLVDKNADLVDTSVNPYYNRAIVGMEVDSEGNIYTVAAFDPDEDGGPFQSVVLKVGKVKDGRVELDTEPTLIASLDGFKAESVALREIGNGVELFIGTDDEFYGGVLRPLQPLVEPTPLVSD
jgi:hypothetical protein